jgi:putative flippase GtrA
MEWIKKNFMNESSKQFIMFYISGGIGTFFFYILYDQMLNFSLLEGSQSWAWTLSYLCSIIWQHALHRYLVFGSSSPYLQSIYILEHKEEQ